MLASDAGPSRAWHKGEAAAQVGPGTEHLGAEAGGHTRAGRGRTQRPALHGVKYQVPLYSIPRTRGGLSAQPVNKCVSLSCDNLGPGILAIILGWYPQLSPEALTWDVN